MSPENDHLLNRITVRIDDAESNLPIGSGVLYKSNRNDVPVYLISAAHCFYRDGETFSQPRAAVSVYLFSAIQNKYVPLEVKIDHNLVSKSPSNDIAVVVLSRTDVESIAGVLPIVQAIKERNSITSFVLKGFPSATKGQEIVLTRPLYVQRQPDASCFQLKLTDDFSTETSAEQRVDGFSGSGVFLETHDRLFLYGIFTRFRDSQKIIYCEYIEAVNNILSENFLPILSFTYLGSHGLTPEFFKNHNSNSLRNLGPRFTERLNLRLPIVSDFYDASKDSVFKQRLTRVVDNWVSTRISSMPRNSVRLEKISNELGELKESAIVWFKELHWAADGTIDTDELLTKVDSLIHHIGSERSKLYEEQAQSVQRNGKGTFRQDRENEPYSNELYWLREISNSIQNFKASLTHISIELANSPFLIIRGDPGCGKSHLLGDIANNAGKEGKAILLFLGQLFHQNQTPLQNILSHLGLTCSQFEFLDSLNSIGRQQASRVLIMIDALNEGFGKQLWRDGLHGLIEQISQYPFIGLIVTVRSTYFNSIISQNLRNDNRITIRNHQGFKGNEYAALSLFCEFYELQTPSFPVLSPEYASPLLMQLICQGIKVAGSDKFPHGLQGMSRIFGLYIDSICEKLANKREEYINRKYLIRKVIVETAYACYQRRDSRLLTLEEVDTLYQGNYPQFPHLLNDLIHENVLIQTTQFTEADLESEMIYFAYERLGDFFIAERLLNQFAGKEQAIHGFKKGQPMAELLDRNVWRTRGLLEAIAVCLPERFDIEIFEVFDWAFGKPDDIHAYDIKDYISRSFWDSLKWRNNSNIDNTKVTAWLNSSKCTLNEDEFFLRLVELTTLHDHPLNSRRLFRNLKKHAMPERDSFWQKHMVGYCTYDDYGEAFPIKRLIDWAWQKGISSRVDPETAELAGLTLAWMLSSTYRALRDQTTKAMVNLFEEQSDALINVMDTFGEIDDLYISERLYAIAYGCSLRTTSSGQLQKIATYVYQKIFENGNPPVHVLLRDYARNTVEYAHSRGLVPEANMVMVRPPYNSVYPKEFPTEQEIECFQYQNGKSEDAWESEKNRISGQIHFSVMSWDFGRYRVESSVRNFQNYPYTTEESYQNFKRSLRATRKSLIKTFELTLEIRAAVLARKEEGKKSFGGLSIDKWMVDSDQSLMLQTKAMKSVFDKSELINFHADFAPFLEAKYFAKHSKNDKMAVDPIKRWIVKKAFELGYDTNKHVEFDKWAERHDENNEFYESRVERIGKKYQWIALHEIIARLADNFLYRDYWGDHEKYRLYQGPWQQFLRDVDPVFTSRNEPEQDEHDQSPSKDNVGWWFDTNYNFWSQSTSKWLNNRRDLPKISSLILRTDEIGEEWVYLKLGKTWDEPKDVGVEKYGRARKEIWLSIDSFLVEKKHKTKVIDLLVGKDLLSDSIPEAKQVNLALFNRENYWSPVAQFAKDPKMKFDYLPNTKFKFIVTTGDAVGEVSEDKSGAHFHYYMPTQILWEGMNLRFAKVDGNFIDRSDKIICRYINPYGLLIRRKELEIFLQERNYEILWTLRGEKRSLTGMFGNGGSHGVSLSGVYHVTGSEISGDFAITERY